MARGIRFRAAILILLFAATLALIVLGLVFEGGNELFQFLFTFIGLGALILFWIVESLDRRRA